MNGVFAVGKPTGPTSQDVVGKLKHIFTKSNQYAVDSGFSGGKLNRRGRKQRFIKIGHGGTLDPLADGVLVIGVGNGTKQLAGYLGQCSKVYTARALLGASTTTYDSQGSVLEYGKVDPATVSPEKLNEVLQKFRGSIKQLPPVFSALKMDGKPLYEYAREGIALPRAIELRDCEVSRLDSKPLVLNDKLSKLPENVASESERAFAEDVTRKPVDRETSAPTHLGAFLDLTFSVSSGTYIRTLIHDIGEALGTKAHMVKLTRDEQGEWEMGKNVLPLELFQHPESVWWPVLKLTLDGGAKQLVDVAELMKNVNEAKVASETKSTGETTPVETKVEPKVADEPSTTVEDSGDKRPDL